MFFCKEIKFNNFDEFLSIFTFYPFNIKMEKKGGKFIF